MGAVKVFCPKRFLRPLKNPLFAERMDGLLIDAKVKEAVLKALGIDPY
jgi:hypothetical protein